MCRIDDGDTMDVSSSRHIKAARKEHKCDECHRVIARGEAYEYSFGVMCGDATDHHMCCHCYIAAQWLMANCSGYIFGEVMEEMVEHAREYPEIAVPFLRVAAGARRKWKRFKSDDLMPVPVMPPKIQLDVAA